MEDNSEKTHPGQLVKDSRSSNFLMGSLLLEHMVSYGISFYRTFDIRKNGEIDQNGVKRAKTEVYIGKVQFFITCLIMGFAVNHYM